jgi:hypothetical protein
MVRDTSSGGGLLHAKYAKPVLNNKKVTARTRFVTDARTDRLITIGRPPQSGGALITADLPLIFLHCSLIVRCRLLMSSLTAANVQT